jgi:hypothetical protein
LIVATFPRTPRVPDHVREQIVADLLSGLTQRAIGRRQGVSQAFVSLLARERGIVSARGDTTMRAAREARRARPPLRRVPSNAPRRVSTRIKPIVPVQAPKASVPAPKARPRKAIGRSSPLNGPAPRIVSGEDRADIVSLWLAGHTKADIAFMTGVEYGQVKPFVQKLSARGGWYSLVYVRPCERCHRPFVTSRSHAAMHPLCRLRQGHRNRPGQEDRRAAE